MSVDWSSIYLFIALLAAVLSMGLMALAWIRRRMPGTAMLIYFGAAIVIWSVAYALEIVLNDFDQMVLVSKLAYLGIAPAMPLWFMFILYRTGTEDWLNAYTRVLLFAPAVIFLVVVFSNDIHQLHWVEIDVTPLGSHSLILNLEHGPTFWLFVFYAYGLFLMASALLVHMALRSLRLYRTQAILLLIGVTIPVVGNMLYLTDSLPISGFDPTPLLFSAAALIVSRSLLHEYLPESLPVAQQTIIEHLEDGIVVVDSRGRIVEVNPAAVQLLGGTAAMMVGQRISTVLLALHHPQVLQVYEELTDQNNRQQRDEAILGRDKVRTFVEITVSHLSTRSGRSLGYAMLLRDINDRKQAQMLSAQRLAGLTALHHVDERISSTLNMDYVMETALDAAIRMSGADAGFISRVEDDQQVIIHAAGYGAVNLVGTKYSLFEGIVGRVARQRQSELICNVTADPDYVAVLPTTCAQMSVPLIVRDSLVGVLNLETSSPLHFNSDRFSFMQLLAGRIATALENARLYTISQSQVYALELLYNQVSTLEQLKTDMIRIASHDLRNPLGTALGYLDLMEMDSEYLIPEHQDYLATLKRLFSRMEAIITDILSLERLQQNANYELVDLQMLVRKVLVDYADLVREKMLRLKTYLPTEPLYVWGDSAQLREAISNLVSNAIKYTPDTGQIDVRLGTMASRVILEISDTGYGIPEELQPRLFEPFFRAVSDKTRTIDGVGLGLNLVKNIVERHQGQMRFKSVYGAGSTFGFALPEPDPAQIPSSTLSQS